MREFKQEDLAGFDGKEGKPAYIARGGKVYDVTSSKLWQNGLHMNRHRAGSDLTRDFQAAPHGPEVFERVVQVGLLLEKKTDEQRAVPGWMAALFRRFPMLRRHPHPMVVHFPIALTISAPVFTLLFLLTGQRPFETTALHCLGGAILLTPAGILTGYLTWWLNYWSRPLRPVAVKRILAPILWGLQIVAFVWRIAQRDVLTHAAGSSAAYLLLVVALIPLVVAIGWFGAAMTFPAERNPGDVAD